MLLKSRWCCRRPPPALAAVLTRSCRGNVELLLAQGQEHSALSRVDLQHTVGPEHLRDSREAELPNLGQRSNLLHQLCPHGAVRGLLQAPTAPDKGAEEFGEATRGACKGRIGQKLFSICVECVLGQGPVEACMRPHQS